MNPEALEWAKFGLSLVNFLLMIIVGLYTWVANRNRVTNERISTFESHVDIRLDDHATRLARLEQDVRHAPNHDDLKALHRRIDQLVASVNAQQGEFKGMSHTLHLIHQHLLNGGK